MIQLLLFKLSYYRWRFHVKRIEKQSGSLKQCLYAGLLINSYNRREIPLSECRQYYITASTYSLHNMLTELRRAVQQYKSQRTIDEAFDRTTVATYRLDNWTYAHRQADFGPISLAVGQQMALTYIEQLDSLIQTDPERSYVERRMTKPLQSFITLTLLMGDIIYQ